MPALTRPQEITFAEMREQGVRGNPGLLLGLQVLYGRESSREHEGEKRLSCEGAALTL